MRGGADRTDNLRLRFSQLTILYANGPEIQGYEVHNRRLMDVIKNENRIEAVDFDPINEMIFWVDSYNKSIKRSYMVNAKEGKVTIGFAQDLEIKSKRGDGSS